ncbi:hypothetical protein P4O66_007991 [Electrophorus voltai]|uniref:Uncharacterized protein n=1 Tax=Electrophorus voltai TaxID=2609070 RepID=A0AAD9DXS6_9TELE|nr:hypothetical protein P4O66_007991 [Electrophorus voltai]
MLMRANLQAKGHARTFSWISLSQPWKGNDLHWLKLMRTSFRFSDEESESDDASMAASMDSEGEVAFVHGIDAVLDKGFVYVFTFWMYYLRFV